MSMDFSNWPPDMRPPDNPPRTVDFSSGPHLFHIQSSYRTTIDARGTTHGPIPLIGWWRFDPGGTGEFAYGGTEEEFAGPFTWISSPQNWWLNIPQVEICGAWEGAEGCLHLFTIRPGAAAGQEWLTYMSLDPQPLAP